MLDLLVAGREDSCLAYFDPPYVHALSTVRFDDGWSGFKGGVACRELL